MAQHGSLAEAAGREGRGAFGGFIGPATLRAQVENTAPWLYDGSSPRFPPLPEDDGASFAELARRPDGWRLIVGRSGRLAPAAEPTPGQWSDYFRLCVAAHFASVATFVPTDVDSKIRVHLWYRARPQEERDRLADFVLGLAAWDVRPVTQRLVEVEGLSPVSGHDGERLSVLCGGLIGFLHAGDAANALRLEQAVEDELRREAAAFEALARQPGRERELLVLAALVTHNAGDVDQGLAAREGRGLNARARERLGELARERPERYGGAYARAALLYRELLAAEGHRHYPLRELRCLRRSPELLSPIGPFFDEWGERLATWPGWGLAERVEAVDALVTGCQKVKGQRAYYRALAGFDRAFPGGLDADALQRAMPARLRRDLREAELRRLIAVPQASFEASLAKKARALLGRRR